MRIDDLQQGLASARDEQLAVDQLAGRRGVDRHVRRQRLERAGIALLVVVLLAGAGTFLATRGTDEQRVISGPGAVPHYLPDPLPPGLPLLDEFPAPGSASGESPFRSAESVAFSSDPSEFPDADSSVLAVRVTTMMRPIGQQPPQINTDSGRFTAYWVEGAHVFNVGGRQMLDADFRSAIASTRVDEAGRVAVFAPTGYREVARYFEGSPTGSSGGPGRLVAASAGPSYFITFDSSTEADRAGANPRLGRSISVSVLGRSAAWLLGPADLTPIEVRGQPGYMMNVQGQSQTATSNGTTGETETVDLGVQLVWWERDDLMMWVTAETEADARALADSIREVDEAKWSRFAASVAPLRESGSGTAVATVSTLVGSTTVP